MIQRYGLSLVLSLAALVSARSSQAQVTWSVNNVTQLVSALAASNHGDTIIVAPGTYSSPSVLTVNRNIHLKSSGGPAVTVLDGGGTHPVLSVSNVNTNCVIDGVTVANGRGIADPSTPSLAGGIQITAASPRFHHCIIRDNVGGAGYVIQSGSLPYVYGTPVDATAGGVWVLSGDVEFHNCVIANNTGGAGHSALFTVATAGPGGVKCSGGTVGFRHCTITANAAGGSGGSGTYGGVQGLGAIYVSNSIIRGNVGTGSYMPPNALEASGLVSPFVLNSNIRLWNGGSGCIDVDPGFASVALHDYHLSLGSPCIDTGTSYAPGTLPDDLEGRSRPQYLKPDMGAFEWAPPTTLSLTMSQPAGPSHAVIDVSGGGPSGTFVTLLTTDAANAGPGLGRGPWGGLFMPQSDVGFEIGFGALPFVGMLDATGASSSTVQLPPGLTGIFVFGVSHTLLGTTAANLDAKSPVLVSQLQ